MIESVATCPGPKGDGCDCDACGTDPNCPWQTEAVAIAARAFCGCKMYSDGTKYECLSHRG